MARKKASHRTVGVKPNTKRNRLRKCRVQWYPPSQPLSAPTLNSNSKTNGMRCTDVSRATE